MRIKQTLPVFVCALALLASCSEEALEPAREPGVGVYNEMVSASAIPGRIRVKFTDGPVDLSYLGNYTMTRTFPVDSRFEERHRAAGLHLWYDVCFDESLPLTRTAADISSMDGIAIVEYVQPVKDQSVFPFNDPFFSNQWHYYNPGTKAGSVKGSDINLLPAWEVTTGRPDVIVAISDGGLDVDHEDLAANIWVNEAEFNGQPGVDDDGNGYVDDIYGYNFVVGDDGKSAKGAIEPSDHGVHVGGTVAAVNNNGVGLCGIAGGNGTKSSGVRLMSTQTSGGSAFIGNAFIYAADNGAVLVNCSWAIDAYSQSISESIDYFNKNAGIDSDGNQSGPMAGGLVIFAAGNENTTSSYPAQQDNVFAVAAVGADYVRSYYTNYGEWVDIAAPGGDAYKDAQIYSTLPNNQYGYMQGTSMACPHVTGVAALVVSQFGGQGFTRQALIDILQGTANNVIYEKNASSFKGMLGAGLVDAGAAVSYAKGTPDKVTDLRASVRSNLVTLDWAVPAGDVLPQHFNIYYQTTPFESLKPGKDSQYVRVNRGIAKAGEAMSWSAALEFDTDYYFLVSSVSAIGIQSEYADCHVKTANNSAPEVTPLDGTSLTLKSHESGILNFDIFDTDGQNLICTLSTEISLAALTVEAGRARLSVNALDFEDGKTYDGHLYVSDGLEVVDTPISIVIEKNHAPELRGKIDDIIFGKCNKSSIFTVDNLFVDADGESLKYECRLVSGSAATVRYYISGTEMSVVSSSYGLASIAVTAADARGAKAETTFSVLVRDGSRPVDIYPNPVKDKLYVRPGSAQTADVSVSNKAGAVVLSAEGCTLDPFTPLTFSMKSLPGGVYYVTIKGENGSETYSVVKQ